MRIALVTADRLPKPDLDSEGLEAAVRAAGAEPAVVNWAEPRDWSQFDLTVLRSPWDYVGQADRFLAWVMEVGQFTRLANPAAVVRWNIHKSYLKDLERHGVAIVPTTLIHQGSDWTEAAHRHEDELVVAKPAVSVGAIGAQRGQASAKALREHLRTGTARGDMLLQAYIPSIEAEGEFSLVYLGGTYSHAIRKRPRPGDFRVQSQHGGTIEDYDPPPAVRRLAELACACAPARLLYARVDLVLEAHGPMVMELEVIEPELFLRRNPAFSSRFAQVIVQAVRGPGTC